MKIFSDKNTDVVTQEACVYLNTKMAENYDRPVLFLTSGGSSLKLLNGIYDANLDTNVTFCLLDERYSQDETVNNFMQMVLMSDFYKKATESGCDFIFTYPEEMETMIELTDRYEVELRKWKRENPDGIIIATVGVGPDGHTSGIMPYPEEEDAFYDFFDTENRWVVGYDALDKNEYPLRITVTLNFLRDEVHYAVSYICGENKKDAVMRMLADSGSLAATPARILREMKDVRVFTDLAEVTTGV